MAQAIEYVRDGRLRALGVTTATRSELLPDVPAIGEFVPGFLAIGWWCNRPGWMFKAIDEFWREWANSGHSAAQAAIGLPQIDPFSLMVNAKNLPTQESLNLKMWPDNGVVRY